MKIIRFLIVLFGLGLFILLFIFLVQSVFGNDSLEKRNSSKQEGAKIDPSDLEIGCFGGKDCIPSLDSPVFETVQEANDWLNADDRVFVVKHSDEIKIYPQRIMNWHEIVNDTFGDTPIAVTFCPLCGTAESFIRKVDGKTAEFGVSGKLYNSDLVMYDRNEDSLWQQITGQAIIGPAAQRNEVLDKIPTTTTTWDEARQTHSDARVLSQNTGFSRNYEIYPYNTYEEDGELLFGVQNSDTRLHPKAVVYGIHLENSNKGDQDNEAKVAKAYSQDFLERSLKSGESLEDDVNGTIVTISRAEADEYTFTQKAAQNELIPLRGFWFAWAAFNPNTLLIE